MSYVEDKAIERKEFEKLSSSFSLDMRAWFVLLEDSIMELMARGRRENWAPDKLIQEIENLIDGTEESIL